MSGGPDQPPNGDLSQAISAYMGGDRSCGDVICLHLTPRLNATVRRFLGPDGIDTDDVTQETLVAVLNHLRKRREFSGDLTKLAVTIANNRCRDILRSRKCKPQIPLDAFGDWLADNSRSPLDYLLEEEVFELLQKALDNLSRDCRKLLEAFYLLGFTMEEIRRRVGLSTVQGVYLRRSMCLREAGMLLKKWLAVRPV